MSVNLCDKCPITAATTCSIQALAYVRGLDGMSHCETHDDVRRMLDVMKSNRSRVIEEGKRGGRIREGSLSPDMARLRRS